MLRRGAEGSERLLRRSRNELCRHQHDRLSGQCLQARAERQLHGNDDPERQRQPDPESLNQSWQGGLTPAHAPSRSEEHPSELQSLMRLSYAVFCLRKKKRTKNSTSEIQSTTTNKYYA